MQSTHDNSVTGHPVSDGGDDKNALDRDQRSDSDASLSPSPLPSVSLPLTSEALASEALASDTAEAGDETNWQPSDLRINWKWLLALVTLGLGSLIVLLIVGDSRQTVELIRQADWRLLVIALLIHYSGFAVRGLRWKMLLNVMGHPLSYLYCTGLLISGWFVSAIIPARAGDIMRVGILRSPVHKSQANRETTVPSVAMVDGISSIVLERVLDMVAILLLGVCFGYWVLRNQLPPWVLTLYGTTILILGVLGLALLILPRIWGGLENIWQNSLWQKLIGLGTEITQKLTVLVRAPDRALIVVGLSLYIWLCDAFLLWLVMQSLGEVIGLSPAAFVALTVDVIAAVPLTPGAIGQIETAYAALLGLMTLPILKLPAIILLTRSISYWSFLLFSGLITILLFGLPARR